MSALFTMTTYLYNILSKDTIHINDLKVANGSITKQADLIGEF